MILGPWCALAALSAPPARDPIEGRWVGEAGPPDNRATLGLDVRRDGDGGLTALLYVDLIGFYGAPAGSVVRAADGTYTVPDSAMALTLAGGGLRATGFLHDPSEEVLLKSASSLPAPPKRHKFPRAPAPVWTARLGGALFAPVAVADRDVYVGNADGVFTALALADGKHEWSFAAGRAIYGEALATGDAVYFVCDDGGLYRLDRATGERVWRYDLGDVAVARILPNPYVYDYDDQAPKPLLVDGVLYVGSGDGSVHAVRAESGERVWRVEAGSKVRAGAMAIGDDLVFATIGGLVRRVRRDSGETVWTFDAGAPVTGAPSVVGPVVVVGARDSQLHGLDPADGHPKWSQFWWGSWVESSAVERDGVGYVGSGDLQRVSAVDPATGRNLWRTPVGGWVMQRPAVTDDLVYAGVGGARRLASFWQPQAGAVVALDRATGQVRWWWDLPAQPSTFLEGVLAAPVAAGDRVLVGGLDGTLYAFSTESRTRR